MRFAIVSRAWRRLRQNSALYVMAAGLGVLPVACRDSRPLEAGRPVASRPEGGMPSAQSEPNTNPGPKLTLAVNDSMESEGFRGAPFFVELGLFHPGLYRSGAAREPLLVASKEGLWTAAVRLKVQNEKGEQVAWPWQLASPPSGTLKLGVESPQRLVWWLTPEVTTAIAEGRYKLTAELETGDTTVAGAWRGLVVSQSASILVRAAPTPLSAAQQSVKYQNLVRYQLLRGDRKEAFRQVDEWLKAQPDNPRGFEWRGDLLAQDGKTKEALEQYNNALLAFLKKHGTKGEPATLLLMKRNKMMAELFPDKP